MFSQKLRNAKAHTNTINAGKKTNASISKNYKKVLRTSANQAGEDRVEGTASRPEQSKFKREDCTNKDRFELAPEISGK